VSAGSDADRAYDELLDQLSAFGPVADKRVLQLDEAVGERLCEAQDGVLRQISKITLYGWEDEELTSLRVGTERDRDRDLVVRLNLAEKQLTWAAGEIERLVTIVSSIGTVAGEARPS
jgi:hypothetical protein